MRQDIYDCANYGYRNRQFLHALPEITAYELCYEISKKYNTSVFQIIYELQDSKAPNILDVIPFDLRDDVRKLMYKYGIL